MPTLKVAATAALDAATKAATDLPELQAAFATVDPRLAASMSTKALIFSKSPIVVGASTILTGLAANYGLSLDAQTSLYIATAFAVVASYVMRYVSTSYISGIVKVPGPTVPAVTAPVAPPAP